jgi:hypothetical protein
MTNNHSKQLKGGIDFGKLLFGRTNCGREIDNIMDSYPDYGVSETQIANACEDDIKNGIPLKPEHCTKLCNFDSNKITGKITRKPRFDFLIKNCQCGLKGGKTRKQRKTKSRKQNKSKSRRQRK